MLNLWRFILKHFTFLLFLALEAVAWVWFLTREPLPRSTVFTASGTVIAGMNSGASQVGDYFSLSSVNRHLAEENARLLEENARLRATQEWKTETDSAYRYAHLQWDFLPAKVVDMTTRTQHNYLVLNKGNRDGVRVGEGVMAHDGVVGVVSAVNSHFALVTPVIHPKMHVSCRLQGSGYTGFLQWKGTSSHYAYLADVARHVSVHPGDTVLTSGLTTLFPEGVMVGVVDEVSLQEGETYHTLRVRLSTDFPSLSYVQVVHNPLSALQESLLLEVR